MTQFLTVDQVLRIHARLSQAPLTDPAGLQSAVAQPSGGTSTGYFYESLFLQAGVLLHRLVMNHVFADGNKRTAWVACVDFLELNDVRLSDELTQVNVADFVESIVTQRLSQEAVAGWLEEKTSV